LFKTETERYLMDVYDRTIKVIESIWTCRDLQSGIMDLHKNTASNRIKGITIMSTIFISLAFIAGIYEMDFQNMPELETKWPYPSVYVFIVILAILMLILFGKNKWL
jgi:magnesium transporter